MTRKTKTAPVPLLKELGAFYAMLSAKRPAHSLGEQRWVDTYLMSIPGAEADDFGNVFVQVGASPATLFSAHTDTVHREDGPQTVLIDPHTLTAFKDDNKPLGADDTTGCWLLKEMIEAGIPGLYIFHRAEEVGGQGSDYIARDTPQRLAGIQRAIAFDRKGTTNVITHQGLGRCCSNTFAQALAEQLGQGYAPDDSGIFTDTANYTELIAECTNLSVGYYHEHTAKETQDLKHLLALRDTLLAVDWDALPTERDPAEIEPYGMRSFRSSGKVDWQPQNDLWEDSPSVDELLAFIINNPNEVADLLLDLHVTYDDLSYYTPPGNDDDYYRN